MISRIAVNGLSSIVCRRAVYQADKILHQNDQLQQVHRPISDRQRKLQQENQRFKKMYQEGLKVSQIFRNKFNELQYFPTDLKLKNTLHKVTEGKMYDVQLLSEANVKDDAAYQRISGELKEVLDNENVPIDRRRDAVVLGMVNDVQARFPNSIWAFFEDLRNRNILEMIMNQLKNFIQFLKNLYALCIDKIKAICKWFQDLFHRVNA